MSRRNCRPQTTIFSEEDVTEEGTGIPGHIASIIEDVHGVKWFAMQIKKETGVIKRFVTPIHDSLWRKWCGKTPGSAPYDIMGMTDITFSV